jgi:hypothetical protein
MKPMIYSQDGRPGLSRGERIRRGIGDGLFVSVNVLVLVLLALGIVTRH